MTLESLSLQARESEVSMVPLAPVHPDGHSCLLREELRAYPDQKRPGLCPEELDLLNHPKTDTQSKVGLSTEGITFLVKRQNLKSIRHLFYRFSLHLDLSDVSLCLNSGYAFW